MGKFQYITSTLTKLEKTIWVCGKCKNDNLELILLGEWKLINLTADNTIPCAVCGGPEQLTKDRH